jgi:hypothetical protein
LESPEEVLKLLPSQPGMVKHARNPVTHETAGKQKVHEFKASLGYIASS